jgi:hypothetical protein
MPRTLGVDALLGLNDKAGGAVERGGAEEGEGVGLARDGVHVDHDGGGSGRRARRRGGGVEGLDGQAVPTTTAAATAAAAGSGEGEGGYDATGVAAVDAQQHVGVELGPQAALDALEGPDAGGEVVGDALHGGGVARADGKGRTCST